MGIEEGQQSFATFVGSPHPNPAGGLVTIPVSLSATGSFEMVIYDTAGRIIDTVHSGELEAGEHSLTWNSEEVPQGMYMLRSKDSFGNVTRRSLVIGGIAGHEQAFDIGIDGEQVFGQVTAVHLGHDHVGHEQVDGAACSWARRMASPGVSAAITTYPSFRASRGQAQDGRLVLHQQDGLASA